MVDLVARQPGDVIRACRHVVPLNQRCHACERELDRTSPRGPCEPEKLWDGEDAPGG